jgi:hypothetical protein
MKRVTTSGKSQQKKCKKEREAVIKPRKARPESWTPAEQLVYVRFIMANKDIMATAELRREHRVFKHIADRLQARSSIQVKSHHQKLMQKFGKINTIA